MLASSTDRLNERGVPIDILEQAKKNCGGPWTSVRSADDVRSCLDQSAFHHSMSQVG
jgi:hypothetical protein